MSMDAQREFEIKCELRSGTPVPPQAIGYIDPDQFKNDEVRYRDEFVGKHLPLDEAKFEAFLIARYFMRPIRVDITMKGEDDDFEIVQPAARVA